MPSPALITMGQAPTTRTRLSLVPEAGVQRSSRVPYLVCIPLLILLGMLDAWAGKGSYLWGDSVSYVDMARGIARGDLWQMVNGLWSPLYPIVLAIFIRPFEASVPAEFTAVRVVNFLIFLGSLFAFTSFLRKFLDHVYNRMPVSEAQGLSLPRSALTVIAYAMFGWAYLSLNEVSSVSPDAMVAAIAFAQCRLLISFSEGKTSWRNFVLFGVLLGIGYWCKAILLPIGMLSVLAAFSIREVRVLLPRLAASMLIFGAILAPMAAALSVKYGHPTLGDSGRLNYAWHVNQVPHWLHWRGGDPKNGEPLHTTRQIFEWPTAFEFGSPVVASYPPWYDAAYWYAGVKTHLSFRQQAVAIYHNIRFLGGLLLFDWVLRAVLLVLAVWIFGRRLFAFSRASIVEFRPLWIVGFGSLCVYGMVHIEARYLPAFLALLVLLLVASLRFRRAEHARGVTMALASLFVAAAALSCTPRLAHAAKLFVEQHGDVHNERWGVADEFVRIGVPPGTPVASIGESWISDWALLARVRVVCEIPALNNEQNTGQMRVFWAAPPEVQDAVLLAFRKAGARIVIANEVPPWASTAGWIHIPNSMFYYRFLDESLAQTLHPRPSGVNAAVAR